MTKPFRKPRGRPRKHPILAIVNEPDGTVRDRHPGLKTIAARVEYLTEFLAQGRWTDNTAKELAADWGVAASVVGTIKAEAQRRLDAYGEKETVTRFIQERSAAWVAEGGSDRVKAAELLLKTNGALTERHEVTHAMAELTDGEVTERAIQQLISDPRSREMVRAALQAHDQGQKVPVQLLSVGPLTNLDIGEAEESFDES